MCLIVDLMEPQSHLSKSGDDGDPSVLIDHVLLRFQDAVSMAMSRIRQRVLQSFVVFSIVSLLLWLAAFLYGSFYYSYMPRAAFSTPVHYYYRCVCELLLQLPLRVLSPLLCFYCHLHFSLQDRLWASCFFFLLLPSGQHLPDEKQETCMYERVYMYVYMCVLNTDLS